MEEGGREKIVESEIVVWTLGALAVDGVAAAIDLTVAGVLIAPVLQMAVVYFIEKWIERRGGTAGVIDVKRVLKYAANLLPCYAVITAFTVTFTFLGSAILHNHPDIIEKMVSAAGGAGGKLGKIVTGAGKAAPGK